MPAGVTGSPWRGVVVFDVAFVIITREGFAMILVVVEPDELARNYL